MWIIFFKELYNVRCICIALYLFIALIVILFHLLIFHKMKNMILKNVHCRGSHVARHYKHAQDHFWWIEHQLNSMELRQPYCCFFVCNGTFLLLIFCPHAWIIITPNKCNNLKWWLLPHIIPSAISMTYVPIWGHTCFTSSCINIFFIGIDWYGVLDNT